MLVYVLLVGDLVVWVGILGLGLATGEVLFFLGGRGGGFRFAEKGVIDMVVFEFLLFNINAGRLVSIDQE